MATKAAKEKPKKPWRPTTRIAKSATRGTAYQREPCVDKRKLKKREARLAKRMAEFKRIVSEVETMAKQWLHVPTSPTAQTIIRWQRSPLVILTGNGDLTVQEQQAAYQIISAFAALAGAMSYAVPPDFMRDRVDETRDHDREVLARVAYVATYQRWRRILACAQDRAHNPCLAVTLAALIDETPLKRIAARLQVRNTLPKDALLASLRLYAALIGNAPKGLGRKWMREYRAFSRPSSRPARRQPLIFGAGG